MFRPFRPALLLAALLAAGLGSVATASPAGPRLAAATRLLGSLLDLCAAARAAAGAILGKGAAAASGLVWSALGGHPALAPPVLLGFLAGIGAAGVVVALLVVMAFARARAASGLR